ncbi:MAG: isocitrate lyase/phosphoenolpyruvate mutase family protein, partial [Methylocella sp.]
FMLTARAENFLHGRADIKDTVRRLQAFQEAGADVLFAPGLATVDDIRAVTSSVDRPVNALMGPRGITVTELAKLGVKRVSVGGALARAALGALLQGGREMREQGTFGFTAGSPSFRELTGIFSQRG